MSNRFVQGLLDQCNDRFSIDSLSMPYSEWVIKNTTLKGRAFSFKDYEFQKKIIDDMHPSMDVIKISQVGLTELQIRKALAFLVRNQGTSLIFSLPNEDMFKRVSNTRIKPIVNKDKAFNTQYDKDNKATRSIDTMQFGQSFLYIVAALEAAATSIPADVIMNDEVDLSDQSILSLFSSRLQASKYKIHQRFSTPTYPSFGIDLNWQTSDQHHYMHRCSCCGHWNHPEFDRNFIHLPGLPDDIGNLADITVEYQDQMDFANSYVMCEKCQAPLDLGDPSLCEWVAKHPHRVNSRGYRISPFATDSLNISYIFKQLWSYHKTEFRRGFYNTVLGLPYSDGNMQLPEADILANMKSPTVPDLRNEANLWVGVDMGNICHITIGQGRNKDDLRIVALYEKHVSEIVAHLKEFCETHHVLGGAVDRHPFTPTSVDIHAATGGKIVPVEYRGTKDMNLVFDDFKNLSHAQVNRTWFLDNFATKIRKHIMPIFGYGHRKQVLIEHFRDMVREEAVDKPAEWKKLHGNDHFFHSSAFMAVAPWLKDVIALHDETDVRSVAMSTVVNQKAGTQNLIGVGDAQQKKVEKLITSTAS